MTTQPARGEKRETPAGVKPAHTPGPWNVSKGGKKTLYIDGIGWWCLAKVYAKVDDEETPEGAANARLIAAAPDLLAACEAIVKAHEEDETLVGGMLLGCAHEMAREAIAKATGGQP